SFTVSPASKPGDTYAITLLVSDGTATVSQKSTPFAVIGTPPALPHITGVQSRVNGTSATISWTTDVPAADSIQWGTTKKYGGIQVSTSQLTKHSFTLMGLLPKTVYHYLVHSSTAAGTATASDKIF